MTCPGCGAPDDQGCRTNCPEFKSEFRISVRSKQIQRVALRDRIAVKLVEMEKMFDPRCKLTLVMRAPHLPDGDLVVTSDSIPEIVTALQRLATYPEVGPR